MSYYIAGGSVYESSSYKVYCYGDHNGYDSGDYGTKTDADMENDDPYWRLGGTGGQQVAEIGLHNGRRIKVTATTVEAWDGSQWIDLLTGGTSYTDAEAIEATNWYYGYFSSGTTPRWLYICSLPTTTAGTLDQVHIEMLGQTWTAGTVKQSYQFQNRSGFTYQWGYEGDYWNAAMNVIVVYDVAGRKDVYVKVNNGYIRFQLKAYIITGNIDKNDGVGLTTVLGKEQIIDSWTTTTPTGTLVFDASNTSSYPPNMKKYTGSITVEDRLDLPAGGYMDVDEHYAETHIRVRNGHSLLAYSTGNDKYIQMYHNDTDGYIIVGTGDLYLNPAGNVRSTKKIYNAVYNDYADYVLLLKGQFKKAGMCYYETGEGLAICNKRNQLGAFGICSDTYGYATGVERGAVPISVAGIVLAYVDKVYKVGTLLVNSKTGILTKAKKKERYNALAMFMRKETKIKTKGVYVKGRCWVKIK